VKSTINNQEKFEMKKFACALVCSLSFLAFAENAPVVCNGTFYSSRLSPWHTSVNSGKFTFAIQDAEGANDGRALCISCTGDDGKGVDKIWGRAYQKINVTPGMNYDVKVRYKTLPGFNGKFELWVRPGSRSDDISVSAGEGWRELTLGFTARSNEATLYLTIIRGTGTVLVDEITVTPRLVGNCNFFRTSMVPWYGSVQSGKFTFAILNDDTAGNGRVLNITCTGDDGKGADKIWGRAYQKITVTKGKRYTFKVKVKTLPGFQGRFEFWVRSGQGKDANRTMRAPAGEGWKEISGFFVAASEEATLYLTIRGGTGSVLVDEVIVEEVK